MLLDPSMPNDPVGEWLLSATQGLRIQATEVGQGSLRTAIASFTKRTGVLVKMSMSPIPSYTLTEAGTPIVPSRLYEQGPQGQDYRWAGDNTDLFVNTEFTELADDLVALPGRRANANYMLSDRGRWLVCTGPMYPTQPATSLCVSGQDTSVFDALSDIHISDHDSKISLAVTKNYRVRASKNTSLYIAPSATGITPIINAMRSASAVRILLGDIPTGEMFTTLMTMGQKATVIVPAALSFGKPIIQLKQSGVTILTRPQPFHGFILSFGSRTIIGSHRFNPAGPSSRDIGIELEPTDARRAAAYASIGAAK